MAERQGRAKGYPRTPGYVDIFRKDKDTGYEEEIRIKPADFDKPEVVPSPKDDGTFVSYEEAGWKFRDGDPRPKREAPAKAKE